MIFHPFYIFLNPPMLCIWVQNKSLLNRVELNSRFIVNEVNDSIILRKCTCCFKNSVRHRDMGGYQRKRFENISELSFVHLISHFNVWGNYSLCITLRYIHTRDVRKLLPFTATQNIAIIYIYIIYIYLKCMFVNLSMYILNLLAYINMCNLYTHPDCKCNHLSNPASGGSSAIK